MADIVQRLDASIDTFEIKIRRTEYTDYVKGRGEGTFKSSGHILTAGKLKPRLFSNMKRNGNYQRALQKAAADLSGPDSQAEAKQRILDGTTRAKRAAKQQVEQLDDSVNQTRLDISRDWLMAVTMVGAAAEQLEGVAKRAIASKLLTLAALIADEWSLYNSEIDFEKIRQDLVAKFREDAKGEDVDEKSIERFAGIIVDIVQVNYYSTPFGDLMNSIVELGRNRVLFESLRNVEVKDSFQELLLAIWKLELNDVEGLKAFRAVLAKLPQDTFLRMTIASFLVYRAYWYGNTDRGRRIFAEASDEALKPLGLSIPVDEDRE